MSDQSEDTESDDAAEQAKLQVRREACFVLYHLGLRMIADKGMSPLEVLGAFSETATRLAWGHFGKVHTVNYFRELADSMNELEQPRAH